MHVADSIFGSHFAARVSPLATLRALAAALVLLPGGSVWAAPHAFSFEDMVKLAKVSDAQITADERVVYFALSRARLGELRSVVNDWA